MRDFTSKNVKSSSKDAMNFAPWSFTASDNKNSFVFWDIAAAMSIFCIISNIFKLAIINVLSALIILIYKNNMLNIVKKASYQFVS